MIHGGKCSIFHESIALKIYEFPIIWFLLRNLIIFPFFSDPVRDTHTCAIREDGRYCFSNPARGLARRIFGKIHPPTINGRKGGLRAGSLPQSRIEMRKRKKRGSWRGPLLVQEQDPGLSRMFLRSAGQFGREVPQICTGVFRKSGSGRIRPDSIYLYQPCCGRVAHVFPGRDIKWAGGAALRIMVPDQPANLPLPDPPMPESIQKRTVFLFSEVKQKGLCRKNRKGLRGVGQGQSFFLAFKKCDSSGKNQDCGYTYNPYIT